MVASTGGLSPRSGSTLLDPAVSAATGRERALALGLSP